MATLVLVRHAVTESTGRRLGGRTPTALSERGRAQAEEVADRLTGVKVTAVYASPVPRTAQTAAAIAARFGVQVQALDGLNEFDYGRWTDRPLAQLRRTRLWSAIQQAPSRVTFPDGESFRHAQQRAVDALEAVAQHHTDRQIVVAVSHADVIKSVVAHYAGVPLDLFQRLVVDPASVSILSLPRSGPPRLVRFNDAGPLTLGGR